MFLNNNSSIVVSKDGWEILKHCDGTKNVDNIFDYLNIKNEISKEDLIKFFTNAKKNEVIKYIDVFDKHEFKIYGSENLISPQIVSIELTDKCNLRCKYCYGDFKKSGKNFWNLNDIELLFEELSKLGILVLEITGGEPLLHPYFKEILISALAKFEIISILSNGVLIDCEIIELVRKYKNRVAFQISIDGCSDETNNEVRGVKNTYNKTLTAIKQLRDYNIHYNVVYMITEENKHEIQKICELFRKEKLNNLVFSKAISFGRACDYKECIPNNNEALYKTLKKTFDLYPDIIAERHLKKIENNVLNIDRNCGIGWKIISISSDGTIISCALMGKSGIIGNYFKQNISEIINSDKGRFYQNFSKTEIEKEFCTQCCYENFCARCIARIYAANLQRVKDGIGLCAIAKINEMDKYLDFNSDFKFSINV
jgi:radical SAM protein with 4Fe4S-binding SPASM domain